MEWIIIVPIGLVLLFLLFGVVLGKIILDNIVMILLIIAIAVIVLVCLIKRPVETFAVVLVLGIIALCVSCVAMGSRENNIPVTISKTTKACQVYDTDGNLIEIPAGAIVARYRDENERVSEGNYFGFLSPCYWHYNGSTYSFIETVVWDKSKWNLEEIAEITYKEFKKGDWINMDTVS